MGSTFETLVLVTVRSYLAMTTLSLLMVIPGMVWLTFEKRSWRQFLGNLLLSFGVTILLGGIMTVLDERTGIGRIPLLMAFVGILTAELLLRWLYGMVRLQQKLYPVELCNGEQRVCCNGLLDTGNMLRVPGKNQAVHIVSSHIPEQLGLQSGDAVGVIGYQSLGTREGNIPIYQIDSLQLLNLAGKKQAYASEQAAVIAQAEPGLLDRKPYQIILHSDIVKNE